MKRLAQHREQAVESLAKPLIALSAVLCVTESITPLGTVDFGLLPALAFAAVCRRQKVWQWALCALGIFAAYVIADSITPPLAAFLGSRPALFGAVNGLYRLAFGTRLETAVLHTDISGALITENGIVTGAADIYLTGSSGAAAAASRWLTGAYFGNVFLPLGAAALLWQNADRRRRALLIAGALCAVLAGDARVITAAVLLLSPACAVLLWLMSGLGYVLAALLQSDCGYRQSASLPALIQNGKAQTVLLLVSGLLLAALYYFIARLWRKHYGTA